MTYTASDLLKGRRTPRGIAFPAAMITTIKNLANEEDSSFSGFVQQAIIEYIIKEKGCRNTNSTEKLLDGHRIARGVSLPAAMHIAIETLAPQEGNSISGFVQQAVIEYIAKEDGQDDTPHPAQ